MTMTHHSQDGEELERDEGTADSGPTPERPRGYARRWSVAQLIAAARVSGDRSSGA
jgi:hypothetical protein